MFTSIQKNVRDLLKHLTNTSLNNFNSLVLNHSPLHLTSTDLTSTSPCKYLVWAPHLERHQTRNNWVAYAHDGDWAAARDRFAKVLYVATRASAAIAGGNLVVDAGSATAAGDVFEPATVGSPATAVTALLAKMEVKCVAQAAPSGGVVNIVPVLY
jgi:hypothetical protein